jgi:hypothetical protein
MWTVYTRLKSRDGYGEYILVVLKSPYHVDEESGEGTQK